MIGVGEFLTPGGRMSAIDELNRNGLKPLTLGPEGLALLNGTQFSTAYALAALFEVANLFGAALVTGVLSTEAAKGSDAPFDPRVHALSRHRGQADCAAALRALMQNSAIRKSHRVGDDRVQDPYCLRCQPQVMGAVLGTLRHVAGVLEAEANGVSDNPLIIAGEGVALSGGNFHAQHVAFAADMMALAICEIGSLAERRIAMLVDPALSRLPAFLTPKPGLNSGFMLPQVTAAALVAENKQRAAPASMIPSPTSATRRITCRWPPTPPAGCCRWRRTSPTLWASSCWRPARAVTFTHRCSRVPPSSACAVSCAAGFPISTTTATLRPRLPPPLMWCAGRRDRGGGHRAAGGVEVSAATNMIVLLGAGASVDAGMPAVGPLTKELRNRLRDLPDMNGKSRPETLELFDAIADWDPAVHETMSGSLNGLHS